MATLKLKTRQPAEEIESWDDDGDFLLDGDDLSRRTSSNLNSMPLRRRDSTSSHVSFRSDMESIQGDEQQFHIPGDDESSTMDAIAAAQHAGIPLPKNVPTSALMGGTIKRLGGRKIQKIIQDDWENDLELPESSKGLAIKTKETADFPDTLRQVSAGSLPDSPTRLRKSPAATTTPTMATAAAPNSAVKSATSALTSAINLEKFKDNDDDDFFGEGPATVRVPSAPSVPRGRQPTNPVSFITPPTPQKKDKSKAVDDDFENDLELPSDGKLSLSTRRDIPTTPSRADDMDWGEGSLGTRWGGTRRDGRSNRSSSASALSPSISSSVTAESEDETFDGLLLPVGPVNFQERLQRRRTSPSPSRLTVDTQIASATTTPSKPHTEPERQDLLDGLDIGDGDVFDSVKLSLHRNIKIKESQPASPARPKTAVSLTFTNKTGVNTRIPRLSHERSHSTALEPVSESGGPIQQRSRRTQSRLGHSAQSSVVSVPTPTTLSAPPFPPSTPRRREVTTRSSFSTLRGDTSTTNAQLLRQKRSMPAVRQTNTPMKPSTSRSDRPPSRDNNRPQSGLRPKTPVERIRQQESPTSHSKKTPMPFLPAGTSQHSSHHATSKGMRQFRRWDSDNAIDIRPISRTYSRSAMRSPSPQRYKVAADTWERLSKPKNKRNFGDGHELDGFDDLPTSKETETRYLRQPNTAGLKPALKKTHHGVIPDRIGTPAPQSPAKNLSGTPRFARDTAASRIARETSLANRVPTNGPLATISAQRGTHLAPRSNPNPQLPSQHIVRSKKPSKRSQQQKPHLIANLNSGKESKTVNGMYYNADTFRWEGNENALNAFDHTTQSPVPSSAHLSRERDMTTPRPALITNISSTKGVQVVGGMVFDPQNMCWLKIGQQNNPTSEASDTMDGFNALDDEEDVFKDIPDLDDNGADDTRGQGRVSDIKDEWLVGEEFDVGPEFIRRQREEEDRWRRKCEKWVGRGSRDRDTWRWTIRELVSQFDDLAV